MVIERGEVWWAGDRPVLVLQTDAFNRSRLGSVVVAAIASNVALADAPGNVLLPADESGLPRDAVVNVSRLLTLDMADLTERVARLSFALQKQVDEGIRAILAL